MSKHSSIGVLALAFFLGAIAAEAQVAKPKIAVFSGQNATIQNGLPLITSNKAREKYGLPLSTDPAGRPLRFDALSPSGSPRRSRSTSKRSARIRWSRKRVRCTRHRTDT